MDALHEELDRSFGNGPPLASVDSRVVAGRGALRRRRVANSVVGLAATAVLVMGWYVVSPLSPTGSERLAADPSLSDTPSASQATEDPSAASESPWPKGVLIRYVDGELEVRPEVIVHEHIRNPYGYEPPGLSDALDVTWRGQRQWLIIEMRPQSRGGTSESSSTPSNGWASFGDYVSDQVSVDGGSGWPDTFQLCDRGQVVSTAGTRVVNRTDDPQLGPTFAPQGATTGAAVVSVGTEERNYFVVWRVIGGSLDVLTTGPDDIVGASFEELLSGARASYTSGEGLR